MAEINLSKYGITGTTEIVYNPSYETLFEEETKPELEGYEKGQESELGAVNVMTGIYTGRSPKDKFIVEDENSKDTVWWTTDEYKNDNHPLSEENWKILKEIAKKELSNKKLFVMDTFCGANEATRMKVSTTNKRLPESCFTALAFKSAQASSVQGLLSFLYSSEVHHTEFSEASFLTKNLSLGERPV
jgi:ATP-dependent phosphoenolpyruvate carboxykinase